MLVAPEAGIPDAESGGDRWWIDHMFLDQKGTPTFVEVKRATDTRIRRAVVGQMLEYAANAPGIGPLASSGHSPKNGRVTAPTAD